MSVDAGAGSPGLFITSNIFPKVLVDSTVPTIRIDGHLCRTKACVSGYCRWAEAHGPSVERNVSCSQRWGQGGRRETSGLLVGQQV